VHINGTQAFNEGIPDKSGQACAGRGKILLSGKKSMAACYTNAELLRASGRAGVLKNGTVIRSGYTTSAA